MREAGSIFRKFEWLFTVTAAAAAFRGVQKQMKLNPLPVSFFTGKAVKYVVNEFGRTSDNKESKNEEGDVEYEDRYNLLREKQIVL